MNKIMGIIRHVLTFGGGILIAMGMTDEGTWKELSGALVTAIGGIWSLVDKIRLEKDAKKNS